MIDIYFLTIAKVDKYQYKRTRFRAPPFNMGTEPVEV